MKDQKFTTIRINTELGQKLKERAKLEYRSMSALITKILTEAVENEPSR